MRKWILSLFMVQAGYWLHAQRDTLDIVSYSLPATQNGWTKQSRPGINIYARVDRAANTFTQLIVYSSAPSSGKVDTDFNRDWQTYVVSSYHAKAAPITQPVTLADGWSTKTGGASCRIDVNDVLVFLNTISGYGTSASIVAVTNATSELPSIEQFLATVHLMKPTERNKRNPDMEVTNTRPGTGCTTTHFDDGWTSTAREHWVEVTRGDATVLLHFPKEGTIFPADPAALVDAAWNILVAPRYGNLSDYKTRYINVYERPILGFGNALDKASGQRKFVLLIRSGSGGWMEFITPDKNTFQRLYKFDPYTIQWDSDADILKPLVQMASYNHFAVSAGDLDGEWNSRFASNSFYANIYSGQPAGMSTYSSAESFVFSNHLNYTWTLAAINSYGGLASAAQGKSSGTFKVINNWQLQCSNIEGKPKTYNAYFSFFNTEKILWLNDAQHPGSGIFTGYSRRK